ncbi:MAG TPA: FHA domain-containing protein [Gemmatimonadales bacterium]
MPYLKLNELGSDRVVETREPVVRLGREPGSTVVFAGATAGVVSARHAEIRHTGGDWVVLDLGSRNGTYVNDRRIASGTPIKAGDTVRLGESGPTLRVTATGEPLAPTVPERPALPAETLAARAETRAYAVTLIDAVSGRRFEAQGTRIRLGRGSECEVRPEGESSPVSRVHAELTVGPTDALVLRDVGSRNGTFLNGQRVHGVVPIRLGDKIMLGAGGPVLIIEGMGTAPRPRAPRPELGGVGPRTVIGLVSQALADAKEERRRGGRGSTAFIRAVKGRIRWLGTAVVVLVLLLAGAVYGVYWLLSGKVAQTERARRTAEDSAAAQVESLGVALRVAQARTAALQDALDRAQTAVAGQLAAGESRRLEAQRELERLREQLAAAERRAPSQAMLDSLRRAVSAAEAQTASLDAKLRAIRGVDFAGIAQQSQVAVGLITAALGGSRYDGSGFVISPDGDMLTNWHVVADSAHEKADTIWVTLADQTHAYLADVIGVSRDRDLALLRIRSYRGPHLAAVDWSGTKARQGEPAALIGFPAGAGFARDRSSAVRTSMSAGILSRVTPDLIQFDGMTTGGSSGSPVFNANGEVISVHRAGLRLGPGFALSVPVRYAVSLFPPELKSRLGL